jgi:hypothetical protein
MGWPTTVVTKVLAAASSTSIASISTAGGGTITLSCATLDTARRISVFSASLSPTSYVITGLNQYGKQITETVIPSTTVVSVGTTTQDFLKVTAITISSVLSTSGGLLVGTSTIGGTPWTPVDTTRNPPFVSFQLTPSSSQTQTSFEYTQSYPNYDPVAGAWVGSSNGPQPTISSLGSSAAGPGTTQGYINFPIVAWRLTFASTVTTATTAGTIMQVGV